MLAGNENLISLGNITIKNNLISKINFNFKNPNLPEVFAGAQKKIISINENVNYQFELIRISKADFPSKKANKNYYIISNNLNQVLPLKYSDYKLSIKLSWLEFLTIKWSKKQTLYHEINPKKEFLKYLIVGIPLLIIGFLVRGCYDKVTNKENDKTEKQVNKKTLGNNVYNK
ncbi:hypothetical protein [Mesonia sp. HuA40]|uniref:hypothetical protein n=1 Tax=Mesonia sp. HuA40 TaxID=2602761 RepID=UPI0011CB7006|nr:hypothetical protein [Mesonia sp. HuA40]TXK71866.1 hypothetical protein FT993_08520 [Mesonia sp. HuA40]